MHPLRVALAVAVLAIGSAAAATGIDRAGMDPKVRPGDDFYAYANGRWTRATAIPQDRTEWGNDMVLMQQAEQRVRGILEAAGAGAAADSESGKIAAAYAAFMDESRAEALGAAPIAADLRAISEARTKADLAALTGQANLGFQSDLFDLVIDADEKSPDRYAVYVSQSGLGLPDRDYYLDAAFAAKRAAYQAYAARMLALASWPDPQRAARDLVAFETEAARASWALADRRDPDRTYHPKTLAELAAFAPGFDWAPFLAAAGLSAAPKLVLNEDSAIQSLAQVWAAQPLETLKAWAAFHVVDSAAPYLSGAFVQARFDFRGRTLAGQQQLAPRWRRAVRFVDEGMGEAVGKVYVARYFPPEAKTQIEALVAQLRAALGRRIDGLAWMSEETRAKAHAKLDRLTVKVGYPDHWRDYSALRLAPGDLAGDARAFSALEWRREVARLNGPVDRSEWQMTPQTVNAYYNAVANEIVFPAAVLAAPYFDPQADPALNYGGIGATIGHELTHGYDDEGRKFDGAGALANWWTPEDARRFEAAAKALNAQYDSYEPFPDLYVKGAQTAGENIADLGGALIALDAYHTSLGGKPAPVIGGLTGDQRFFLAYAQAWRVKRRDDAMRELIVSDVHAPETYRVDGVVRNMDAWYDAFHVGPGEAYYLAPTDRVRIW